MALFVKAKLNKVNLFPTTARKRNQTAYPGNKKAASQNRETAVCCQDHDTNYPLKAGIGKMVRSPGPVRAGFGLDDGEVFHHLTVVAIGYWFVAL
jgi:hypothetical protein